MSERSIVLLPIEKHMYHAHDDIQARNASIHWLRTDAYGTAADQMKFYDMLDRRYDMAYMHIYDVDHKKETREHVGICGLTDIIYGLSAEFSLLIHTKHRGKGFGEKALIELLKWGFEDFELDLIFGETFIYPNQVPTSIPYENKFINPAWKLFQKVGFEPEGVCKKRYQKAGVPVDALQFSISRARFSFDKLKEKHD